MGKKYYISDLHLFHKNITKDGTNFDNRPFNTLEEMHDVIVSNWNSTITNADDVYLLGDICWKENETAIQLVSKLKGKLHLIRGNHDVVSDERYRRLFCEILDYKEVKDILNNKQITLILSHYPLASWKHMRKLDKSNNTMKKYNIHLYGHVHNSEEYKAYIEYLNTLENKYNIQTEAYNVGCMLDYMEYRPKTIQEIVNANRVDIPENNK